jgi:hypothetical protein
MSDALSDLAHDQQRAEASREMWMVFGAFADAPSAEREQAALESAKNVDSINGGYWGGCTPPCIKKHRAGSKASKGGIPALGQSSSCKLQSSIRKS